MRKKNKIYLSLLLLLFSSLVIIHHFVPSPVDWSLSFNGNKRSPYACSVARELMKVIFPGKDIKDNNVSLFQILNQDTLENRNLIIISNEFSPEEPDLSALLDFAARGNAVFLSSLEYPGKLCDTLRFQTEIPVIDSALFKPVKEFLKLSFSGKSNDTLFTYRKSMPDCSFTRYDTLNSVPLGTDRAGRVNFIRIQFGKGEIYIHCQPLAFTNFHILYGNFRYACTALSYLPVRNTIWDQYYKPDRIIDLSPVRYILSEPPLKAAYFLILITILIYLIYGSKRTQRIIPVISPEQNTSLDFINTISTLYFRGQNHADLARKKFVYFNDFIRNRYFLQGFDQSAEQVRTLAMRSGVEETQITGLLQTAGTLACKRQISKQELIGLHKLLEDFYSKCK
jgi:hypothetical protein